MEATYLATELSGSLSHGTSSRDWIISRYCGQKSVKCHLAARGPLGDNLHPSSRDCSPISCKAGLDGHYGARLRIRWDSARQSSPSIRRTPPSIVPRFPDSPRNVRIVLFTAASRGAKEDAAPSQRQRRSPHKVVGK